ncbi:hypothetical protein M9H77_04587 [Catharanthus roseus]|uniref:Uncharacterized protein n=1 Tax=Catharanthus roseus TaxID=4058 RepID=A0ACC0CEH9_CATRO|nr:hypothetical protein M9H77_04587 [Catharanthus roseus]
MHFLKSLATPLLGILVDPNFLINLVAGGLFLADHLDVLSNFTHSATSSLFTILSAQISSTSTISRSLTVSFSASCIATSSATMGQSISSTNQEATLIGVTTFAAAGPFNPLSTNDCTFFGLLSGRFSYVSVGRISDLVFFVCSQSI